MKWTQLHRFMGFYNKVKPSFFVKMPLTIYIYFLRFRYAEFAASLLSAFKKQFPKKKDDKIANAAKLRVDLRVFTDLLIIGW